MAIFRTLMKPIILFGPGTTRMAELDLKYYMMNSGARKNSDGTFQDGRGYYYVYNMEVYKRGKHRARKNYKIFIYRVSESWAERHDVKIIQKKRNFKVEKNNNHNNIIIAYEVRNQQLPCGVNR